MVINLLDRECAKERQKRGEKERGKRGAACDVWRALWLMSEFILRAVANMIWLEYECQPIWLCKIAEKKPSDSAKCECEDVYAHVCVFAVQVLPINKAALRIDIYSINLLLPPAAATALAATATAAAIFHSFIKKSNSSSSQKLANKSWWSVVSAVSASS